MGCTTSKLDDEGEMPAGLRPFRGRIEEMKRRRRVRSVSIVSTAELLKPEVRDEDECEKKAAIRMEEVYEEFPRSPSFRVYFLEAESMKDSDDDSVKVIQKIKEAKLAQEKETTQEKECKDGPREHGREGSHDCLMSNEDIVSKPGKEKWKMFKMNKAQSHVYSFLTIKSCYSPNNTNDAKIGSKP